MIMIVVSLLIVFTIEVIGVICLTMLLFVKSNLSISFKEFCKERLQNIIVVMIILIIGDVLIIIMLFLR